MTFFGVKVGISRLMGQELDKDQVDKDGWDAYIYAAYNGHVHIMEYLENTHDWNIHIKGTNGKSAFTYMNKHINVKKHLAKKLLKL